MSPKLLEPVHFIARRFLLVASSLALAVAPRWF